MAIMDKPAGTPIQRKRTRTNALKANRKRPKTANCQIPPERELDFRLPERRIIRSFASSIERTIILKASIMNNRTFTQDLLGAQNDLLRFAYKLTANREEANDLLQETSLKALDNEEKYTPDTNFKGWVYTIMRNIFINNYRKVVRDQTFVDTTDNLYHLNTPHDLAPDNTESAYDLKEMHRIVNALPREYKIPFSMHVSGFKYREIAERLGLPLGTVKSRIFFTRQKLQQELKDFR